MYTINKITSNHVVDFAAEELKKYLRMMMPRCGEIAINYNPEAKDGFRLGVMSDFGLDTSESSDVTLDDILHIDTDTEGGIIAGSNPRSVLLAVYRYLTINGCRWLFPGIDGEFIPIKDIEPTKYHKMADCRYRGQCNEGAEAQHLMMEAIDFTPKIGMNIFMIEFENPTAYYNHYYDHQYNKMNRAPEPVTNETIFQWKRQCEAEIAKRGLQFHDMGHGWTAEAFKIKSDGCWSVTTDDAVPEEYRPYLAEYQGKRALYHGAPLNTNICMSNPKARRVVAESVADYAALATNVDYLHVWLSDSYNNCCECPECRKKTASDWYVMLMNDIDTVMTERGLNSRVVFICYYDTIWAPKTEKLNNPDRFALLLAAITRDYTKVVSPDIDESKLQLTEYELNTNVMPTSVDNYLIHAKQWREICKVSNLVYEYHFWVPQFRDFGLFGFAKTVYDDIRGYKANGCSGLIEDGSQRSFFPNGLPYFVYASTLFDTNVDFEALKKDYTSHAYGTLSDTVCELFTKLGETVSFQYLMGGVVMSSDTNRFYNPEMANNLRKIPAIVDEYLPTIEANKNMPYRAQTVAVRMLLRFLDFVKRLALVFAVRADGDEALSDEKFWEFVEYTGQFELEMERCFDHYAYSRSLNRAFGKLKNLYDD